MHYHQLHTMHLHDDDEDDDDVDDADDDDDDDDDADDVDAVDDASDPGKATGFGLFLFHMSKVFSCKWTTIQWKNGGNYNEREENTMKWRNLQQKMGENKMK